MKGSGVGATYDRNREVLWLLDQAKITVARRQVRTGRARRVVEVGRPRAAGELHSPHAEPLTSTPKGGVIDADEITIALTPATPKQPDQRVRQPGVARQQPDRGGRRRQARRRPCRHATST